MGVANQERHVDQWVTPVGVKPEQFIQIGPTVTPEKKLALAQIESAVDVVLKHVNAKNPKARQEFRGDFEWIFAESDDDQMSFENCCARLALDPQFLRRGIQRALAARRQETKNGSR